MSLWIGLLLTIPCFHFPQSCTMYFSWRKESHTAQKYDMVIGTLRRWISTSYHNKFKYTESFIWCFVLCRISRDYLVNTKIFDKIFHTKYIFFYFHYTFYSKYFWIPEEHSKILPYNYVRLHAKCLLLLCDFNQNWISSTEF